MKKYLGFSSLFLAAVVYGSFGVWVKLLSQHMSIYQQVVLRNAFAFVVAFLIILVMREWQQVSWHKIKKSSLLFFTFLVPIDVILYNVSILSTKIALATFAFYIGTILTGWVVGVISYKEKLTVEKWLSLILVLAGLAMFVYPFPSQSLVIGLGAGVLSGILDGISNGFRKDLSGKISKWFLVLLTTIGGVAVSGLMMVYFQQNLSYLTSLSLPVWGVAAFFGFCLVAVNYLLLVGFQNFDVSLGSIVLSLELLFATVFGFLILHEVPSSRQLLGGALILFANVVPNLKLGFLGKRTQPVLTNQ